MVVQSALELARPLATDVHIYNTRHEFPQIGCTSGPTEQRLVTPKMQVPLLHY